MEFLIGLAVLIFVGALIGSMVKTGVEDAKCKALREAGVPDWQHPHKHG